MATDSRRLPVPETSRPPCAFLDDEPTIDILTDTKQRFDGRSPNEHRPIFAQVGVVTQARGSAYIEMGQTKVISAIFGPREAKFRDEFSLLGQITCELKFATFSGSRRGQHQQSAAEKEASMIVKDALAPSVQLDKFPKAKIEVFIIILEDGGSALAAAISCASLALCDGGIEMFDVAVGISLRRYGDITLIDPNRQEEVDMERQYGDIALIEPNQQEEVESEEKSDDFTEDFTDCRMTIGYMLSLNQVSAISQTGVIEVETSELCQNEAIAACRQVHAVLKKSLVKSIGRQSVSMTCGAKEKTPLVIPSSVPV